MAPQFWAGLSVKTISLILFHKILLRPKHFAKSEKQDVVSTKYSYISIMYPGLINRMNEEELKDLIAYLMAGGNDQHEIYKNQ